MKHYHKPGLAKHKDIEELTEEAFYRIVGDYFSAKARIKEIDKVLEELQKGRNKLPKMEVFETYAEYLTVKQTYESFDELTQPVECRVMAERDDKSKLVGVLSGRLRELLPQGVWFRYGDQALKVDYPTETITYTGNYRSRYRSRRSDSEVTYTHLDPVIHIKPWRGVRPIPPAMTRAGKPQPGLVPSLLLILSVVGAIGIPGFAVLHGGSVLLGCLEGALVATFGIVGVKFFAD